MFVAAARALSAFAASETEKSLLPPLERVREVSRHVALAVAREAQRLGLAAPLEESALVDRIEAKMWTPEYLPYRHVTK